MKSNRTFLVLFGVINFTVEKFFYVSSIIINFKTAVFMLKNDVYFNNSVTIIINVDVTTLNMIILRLYKTIGLFTFYHKEK